MSSVGSGGTVRDLTSHLRAVPVRGGSATLADARITSIWGKKLGSPVPHPLVCHVLDTFAVAEVLLPVLVGPRCRAALQAALSPSGSSASWVALLCGFHDLGKCSPAFQALEPELARRLLDLDGIKAVDAIGSPRTRERLDTPHGIVTAVRLAEVLVGWGAPAKEAKAVGAAVGGHHGSMPDADQVRYARSALGDNGGERWAQRCQELVERVVALCGLRAPEGWGQVRFDLPALVGLAGLASVSDWIASDKRFFPHAGPAVDLGGYIDGARLAAAAACAQLDLARWIPPADTRFSTLFPADRPRPVQFVVEQLAARVTGPALVIVEAPTGEGKTKAALQLAATIVGRLGLSGCFVATPTRATSQQALQEVQRVLHGSDVVARLVQGLQPSSVDAYASNDAGERSWFRGKRGLATTAGAGPIDQVLMAATRSRHVFVRLTAPSGKVVVIDEAHAYYRFMNVLLDQLLSWLGALGVPVIVLSATLPELRRTELIDSWRAGLLGLPVGRLPAAAPRETAGQARVTWTDGDVVRSLGAGVSSVNAGRRVCIARIDDVDVVDWVLSRTAQGGSAAVIHNTVRRTEEAVGFNRMTKAVIERAFADRNDPRA